MIDLEKTKSDQKAFAVFTGKTDVFWLRLFRPGFRHCYLIFNDGTCWTSVDPLSHYTEVAVHHHVRGDFDLPGWLSSRWNIVVPAQIDRGKTKSAPIAPFSCVEAVKRMLGIHRLFVFTPWQLYRHLTNDMRGGPAWAV